MKNNRREGDAPAEPCASFGCWLGRSLALPKNECECSFQYWGRIGFDRIV